MVRVPCAALRGNLRCSPKSGSSSNSPSAQTIARPDPISAALLGPARRVEETNADAGRRGSALRDLAGTRSRVPHPSVCAEERRSRRTRTGDCLSVASSSPAPAGPSTAGCPGAKRRGRRQQGRLFFGDFLLARQKKVTCRRATPGLQADPGGANFPAQDAGRINAQGTPRSPVHPPAPDPACLAPAPSHHTTP